MPKYKSLEERIAATSQCFKKREKKESAGPTYESLGAKLLMESPCLQNELIRKRIWNQKLQSRQQKPAAMRINLTPPRLP